MNTEFKCFGFFKQFLESLPEDTQKFIVYDWQDDEHGGCGMMMNDDRNAIAYVVIAYTSIGTFYCHKVVSKDDEARNQKIQSVISTFGGQQVNITKEMDKFVITRP